MIRKRAHSRRMIKILALQRACRILSLMNNTDIYMPELVDDSFPYRTELTIEIIELQGQLRNRIGKLAGKEFGMPPRMASNLYGN